MTGTMKARLQEKAQLLEASFAFLPLIFRRCVAPKSQRYDLSGPAILNEHVYATDGRIIVRMAHTPAIVAAIEAARSPGSKFPRADKLPEWAPDLYEPEGQPIPPPTALPPCPECKGAGVVFFVDCPKCRRDCVVKKCKACGHVMDCEKCGGKGKVEDGSKPSPCEFCEGSKVKDGLTSGLVISGGPLLSHKYLILLREVAPEARIWIAKVNPSRSAVRLVMGGGVEGLLMPIRLSAGAAGGSNLNPEPR